MTNSPETLASPDQTLEVHSQLTQVIESAPQEFVWGVARSSGGGTRIINGPTSMHQLRLMSQPDYFEDDTGMGEVFPGINYFSDRDLDDPYAIMFTEEKILDRSPWGDVLGSLAAGAIVTKRHRADTAFVRPDTAKVRQGHFTFGPAQLEKQQNAAQAANPFEAATLSQVERIGRFIADGILYAHNGEMQLPSDPDEIVTLPVSDILVP